MKFILECDGIDNGEWCDPTPDEIRIKTDIGEIRAERALINCLTSYAADTTYQEGVNHGYRFGQEEAQETYRKLINLGPKVLRDIFDTEFCFIVINKYTVDEIKQKLKEYDNRIIKVGDEVKTSSGGSNAVVTLIYRDEATIVYRDGSTDEWELKQLIRTGRHYDEVEKLLQKLMGE